MNRSSKITNFSRFYSVFHLIPCLFSTQSRHLSKQMNKFTTNSTQFTPQKQIFSPTNPFESLVNFLPYFFFFSPLSIATSINENVKVLRKHLLPPNPFQYSTRSDERIKRVSMKTSSLDIIPSYGFPYLSVFIVQVGGWLQPRLSFRKWIPSSKINYTRKKKNRRGNFQIAQNNTRITRRINQKRIFPLLPSPWCYFSKFN